MARVICCGCAGRTDQFMRTQAYRAQAAHSPCLLGEMSRDIMLVSQQRRGNLRAQLSGLCTPLRHRYLPRSLCVRTMRMARWSRAGHVCIVRAWAALCRGALLHGRQRAGPARAAARVRAPRLTGRAESCALAGRAWAAGRMSHLRSKPAVRSLCRKCALRVAWSCHNAQMSG